MPPRLIPAVTTKTPFVLGLLLTVGFIGSGRSTAVAQLVADGATNTVSGYTTNITGELTIGTNGPFTQLYIINGGVVTNTGDAYIGRTYTAASNQVEVADVNSSWWVGSNLWVGRITGGSYNRLVVTNGATVSCYQGTLGAARCNTATVSGAGSTWTMQSDLAVGDSALTNRLLVSQGGLVADHNGYIGTGSRSSLPESHLVLVTDSGSVWTNALRLYVGDTGDFNELVVSNGGVVINTDGFIGYDQSWTSNNTATVTGPGSLWHNRNDLIIGYYSSGNRLVVADGGTVSNDVAYLGRLVMSSNNVATITGPGSLWDCKYNLLVGHSGPSNRLEIIDGGTVRSLSGHVGFNFNTSNNTAVVAGPGSAWVLQTNLWVGYAGEGNRLVVTNGGTVQARVLYVGYFSESNQNLVFVEGGSILATNLVDLRRGRLVLQSGLLTTAALWLTNGPQSRITINGGTVRCGSTIHQTGSPLVVGGGDTPATFELADSGAHQFSSGLLIASNGLLTGSGAITGNVTVGAGGAISPGAGLGQLSLGGDLVLSNGSRTIMELNAAARSSDLVSGLTTVAYGGTLTLTNLAGTISASNTFKLFSADAYPGAFSTLTPASPGDGLAWNTNTLASDGTLRVVSIAPVTIISTVSGSLVTLSWPTDQVGWRLQAQTNSLSVGVGTNWFDVPASTATNQLTFPLDPTAGSVFYRLVWP